LRNSSGSFAKLTEIRRTIRFLLTVIGTDMMLRISATRNAEFSTMSIVEFKRAKLLQDARLSGITVEDIARALATMAGVKAVGDFDAGLSSHYLGNAEALLELAIEFAQERRRND
jgi:hypothetical protein